MCFSLTLTEKTYLMILFIRRGIKTFTIPFILLSPVLHAQSVSGIITDYNGFWKSSTTSLNSIKPANSHNLLAFTYNGTQYSTGVNNTLLTSHGETFSPQDFWSLPIDNISGAINGNTKVGLGEMYDGIHHGASNPAPEHSLTKYLTDGIKGLGLGTCIANLPQGSMTFFVNAVNPALIGDGIPDILVTQIADPSSSSDNYEFTNETGTRIGNNMNIAFTSITPVGTWTADFYELSSNPLILTSGYTDTDRPLRLWAADLSEFGITAANYLQIKKFKINLSGNSDVAFVAYNANTVSLVSPLPVNLTYFNGIVQNTQVNLSWQTATEINTSTFEVERSADGINYTTIGNINASGNSTVTKNYFFTDINPINGTNYYRLKTKDIDGKSSNSNVVMIKISGASTSVEIRIYPNPATENIFLEHPLIEEKTKIIIYNTAGIAEKEQVLIQGSTQTSLQVNKLTKGLHYLVLQTGDKKMKLTFVLQ